MLRMRAVLFDMGGTLVHAESIPETFHKILKAHGVECSIAEISAAWKNAMEQLSVEKMADFGRRFWVEFNLWLLKIWELRKMLCFWRKQLTRNGGNTQHFALS